VFDKPEMLDADLSSLALDLAAWGAGDPDALSWLDPPPQAAWREARALLTRIGALDAEGRLTAHGGVVARLPLPPRLAHMVVASATEGDGPLAARIAVLLTEQGLGGRSPDLEGRLQRFARDKDRRSEQARNLASRIARLAGANDEDFAIMRAGLVLARGFPDRVAKARGDGSFLMANGRAASVDATENLAREAFLVIADATGAADRARILSAAPISAAEIEALFADEIEDKADVLIDANGARARRRRTLGRIVLSEGPAQNVSQADFETALLERVREEGLGLLPMADAAQARARVALLKSFEPDAWPDWSDEALLNDLDGWLISALSDKRRLSDVNIAQALLATLDYAQRRRLDAEAPTHVETPAGGSAPIDYLGEGGPFMDVRPQEMFGVSVHPSIANGRVLLTLRLLSPAQRPLQTTRDLAGFWRGSYAAVRSEMRGRYPKHPWPEDPLSAPPTRRVKPRP
jgi:ATP-dependent helicase HrpB